MTDNEIIKALECHTITMKCGECPYDNAFIGDGDVEINVVVNNNCFKGLGRDAIALIKRQQAEIERLKNDIFSLANERDAWADIVDTTVTETIKEFAEKLKEKVLDFVDCNNEAIEDHIQTNEQPNVEFVEYVRGKVMGLYGFREQIDNLVAEMVGDSNA